LTDTSLYILYTLKEGHITQTLTPMWLLHLSQVPWIPQWFKPSYNRNINYLANIGWSLILLTHEYYFTV